MEILTYIFNCLLSFLPNCLLPNFKYLINFIIIYILKFLVTNKVFLLFRIQSIANNKFLVVLELDDVIETDAGLYKVKAKNKMGEVAASINLNFSREYQYASFFFT